MVTVGGLFPIEKQYKFTPSANCMITVAEYFQWKNNKNSLRQLHGDSWRSILQAGSKLALSLFEADPSRIIGLARQAKPFLSGSHGLLSQLAAS